MTDEAKALVQRLRRRGPNGGLFCECGDKAADRIEALSAENERLREAFAKCVAVQIFPDGKGGHKVSASFDNYKAANPLFSLLTRYISDDRPALGDVK